MSEAKHCQAVFAFVTHGRHKSPVLSTALLLHGRTEQANQHNLS